MASADLQVDRESDEPDVVDTALSKDVIFEVLKNRRRREVLEYLQSTDGEAKLSELAERIAAWENDITVAALNSTQRKRVYVALYQTHLPKMDDAGVIDYDSDRGTVRLADNADILQMYLSDDFNAADPWHRRYVVLSLLGGGILLVSQVSGRVATVTGTMLTLAVVGMLLFVSLIHMRDQRRTRRQFEAMLDRIE